MKHLVLVMIVGVLVGCGKEEVVQPSVLEKTKTEAQNGNRVAQNNLGAAYYNGQGVEQDLNEAIKWYKKAADLGHGVARWNLETIARQGHAGAQYNVGLLYHEGIGIKQNNVTAYAWWDNAATNGYQDAKEKKTIITERITPAQIVKAEELVLEMTKNHPKLLNK